MKPKWVNTAAIIPEGSFKTRVPSRERYCHSCRMRAGMAASAVVLERDGKMANPIPVEIVESRSCPEFQSRPGLGSHPASGLGVAVPNPDGSRVGIETTIPFRSRNSEKFGFSSFEQTTWNTKKGTFWCMHSVKRKGKLVKPEVLLFNRTYETTMIANKSYVESNLLSSNRPKTGSVKQIQEKRNQSCRKGAQIFFFNSARREAPLKSTWNSC